MLTNLQLQSLHILRRKLTTATHGHFDDDAFRMVVRNLGRVPEVDGHVSSKALDNVGFERVMCFLETQLVPYDSTVGTRWREIDTRRRRHLLSTRQEWEIHHAHEQLVASGKPYRLGAIVKQMSEGRTEDPREISSAEAHKVIEMLHAATARQKVES